MDIDKIKDVNNGKDIVSSFTKTQSHNARFLWLDNVYEKCSRPNDYHAGRTFDGTSINFMFSFRTETVGDIYLLHLSVMNCMSTSFTIKISSSDKFQSVQNNKVFLSKTLKECVFSNVAVGTMNYLTTYDFSQGDLDMLLDKQLWLHVELLTSESVLKKSLEFKELIDQVKYSHDYGELLKDGILSNFIIESSDGHKFNVHKIILSTQSDVFNAMLKDNTAESQNNFVKLVDVNKDDLKCILEFIYTGTITDTSGCNAINLLIFADKYDFKGLFLFVEHLLSDNISVENAMDILEAADACNSVNLKLYTFKVIKKHRTQFMPSSLKSINNKALLQELCCFLAI